MKFSSVKTVVGLGVAGAAVVFTTACSGASQVEIQAEPTVILPEKSLVAVAAVKTDVEPASLEIFASQKNGSENQPAAKAHSPKTSAVTVQVSSAPLFEILPQTTTSTTIKTTLNADTQAANVRSGPGLEFEVLDVIDNTQTIVVKGRAENSNWLQIDHNGELAWLAGDLIAHQYLLDTLPAVNTNDLVPETEATSPQQPEPSDSYVGIGARLGTRDGWPAIEAPFVGSPADQAGLQPGDIILAVDGQNVAHLSLGEIVNRIRGEIGVPVILTVSRPNTGQQLDIVVVRGEIDLLKAREVCVAHPIRGFGETWNSHPEVHEWLGCPFTNFRRDEHATAAAVQTFERGWMLWLETDTVANVDPIYVFFEDDHSYVRFGDRPLVDAHSYYPTPNGYYKVGDRFAKVYWEELTHQERARLGFGINEARDSNGAFQEFENGRMFWAGEADTIYVIYQGYFDVNGDGQISWTQGWMAYEDTFEEPVKD